MKTTVQVGIEEFVQDYFDPEEWGDLQSALFGLLCEVTHLYVQKEMEEALQKGILPDPNHYVTGTLQSVKENLLQL